MVQREQLCWYSFRLRTGVALALLVALAWRFAAPHLPFSAGPFAINPGPAGPAVAREPFELGPWREGPTLLLGLGDSITRGFGAPPGFGYFDLLAGRDDDPDPDLRGLNLRAVFPRLEVRNLAWNGSTSADHLRYQALRIARQPMGTRGVVAITTGGNDLIHDYGQRPPRDGALYGAPIAEGRAWAESFRDRLRRILDQVAAAFPGGCEIFLASIYDPTDGVGDIENSRMGLPAWPEGLAALEIFNRVIAETCGERRGVHLVDLRALFLGHGIHCQDRANPHHDPHDPYHWYFTNLEDPNERGHDAIRRIFLTEMAKVLAPSGASR